MSHAALAELAGLFVSALVAATLVPAQSEAVLVALLVQGTLPAWLLVLVAGVGNVLGSIVNWVLGRMVERFRGRRWFPASDEALDRAQRWYGRFGHWSLLLAWLPVVGDPLTLAAGILREPLWRFVLLVAIGKFARYAVLVLATRGLIG